MIDTLSLNELAILIGGTTILLLTLCYFFLRNKKAKPAERLGIHEKIAEENPWWQALEKSRSRFSFFSSASSSELREQLEEACLASDLGVANTQAALSSLPWESLLKNKPEELAERTKEALSLVLENWIHESQASTITSEWPISRNKNGPTVIWFVGVNGVGKTTSIAKLAQELINKGHSVMLAAGDTFRAAASEQLETWANRLGIPCVRGQDGSDSSAVLFDAIESAKSKNIDFVLCDSAGRLHTNNQLMDALAKNKRVMDKALSGAPHETLLVLDANTGQNMIKQSENFLECVAVSGLILSKLDGSARGGAVVAVARKTQLPIRRLGIGEKADEMTSFDAKAFSRALVGLD